MTTRIFAAAIFAAFVAGVAHAQAPAAQAPAPNPRDVIPDQMPYSTPYGAPITFAEARRAIAAAEAEAKKRGWPECFAVYDSGGDLVAFDRMDGAPLGSIEIAQHKARTAVKFRRDTKDFESAIQSGTTLILTLDDVIGSRGGILLVRGGKIIGAIGASGGTGSQDELLAKVGAEAIGSGAAK
jgi:glc operon protein GlcG